MAWCSASEACALSCRNDRGNEIMSHLNLEVTSLNASLVDMRLCVSQQQLDSRFQLYWIIVIDAFMCS